MRPSLKQWRMLLALLVASTAVAQSSLPLVSVSGVILDPSGASAPEAVVTLQQGTSKVLPSVKTDVAGRFVFNAVPEGTYSIEVTHEGFEKSVARIRVSAKTPPRLTIVLVLAEVCKVPAMLISTSVGRVISI